MNLNLTLLAQAVAFFVFIWFTVKFVWPPMLRAIETRQKQIADGLAAGERGKQELESASRRADESVKQAKERATEIISQAERRAVQMIEEAKVAAKAEGDRLAAGAKAEIEQEVNAAAHAELLAQLKKEI